MSELRDLWSQLTIWTSSDDLPLVNSIRDLDALCWSHLILTYRILIFSNTLPTLFSLALTSTVFASDIIKPHYKVLHHSVHPADRTSWYSLSLTQWHRNSQSFYHPDSMFYFRTGVLTWEGLLHDGFPSLSTGPGCWKYPWVVMNSIIPSLP